jgi:hypothetical protein
VLRIVTTLPLVVTGILLIWAAKARWWLLVDPPKSLSTVYSQALIKRLFGTRFLILFTYCLGVLFVAAGFLFLWKDLQ